MPSWFKAAAGVIPELWWSLQKLFALYALGLSAFFAIIYLNKIDLHSVDWTEPKFYLAILVGIYAAIIGHLLFQHVGLLNMTIKHISNSVRSEKQTSDNSKQFEELEKLITEVSDTVVNITYTVDNIANKVENIETLLLELQIEVLDLKTVELQPKDKIITNTEF
ncbi:MAG: hypothetical protein KKB37_01775 [Alphaproteobacteria bacterium]|nr:hypothetical protein [Alphaproteobacteria bacterium]